MLVGLIQAVQHGSALLGLSYFYQMWRLIHSSLQMGGW
jgi:hypothetical protein